jgi:hypothetical protein
MDGKTQGILDAIEVQLEVFKELANEKPVISTEFVVKQFEILKRVVEK